jgi:hypothetical protein
MGVSQGLGRLVVGVFLFGVSMTSLPAMLESTFLFFSDPFRSGI